MKLVNTYLVSVFFIFLLQNVAAKPVKTYVIGPQYKWMQSACDTLLSSYTYGYNDTSSSSEGKKAKKKAQAKQLCTYPPSLGSMVLCMGDALGSESKSFEKSLKLLEESCIGMNKKKNLTMDDLKDAYKNATEYALDPPEDKKTLKKTTFYQPVRVPEEHLKNTTKYYSFLYFNLDSASMLAGITYVYFLIVFIFFGSSTFVKRLGFHRRFNNKYLNWYRANVSLPALFNGKHTEAPVAYKIFSTLIPTRMESIVIFLLICLNILLSTVHYSFDYTESSWVIQFTGGVADRTGIMAFGYIPLLIIFAGRNNILTSLTGIPFQAFIHYHKWVARLMWANALVHSIMYTVRAIVRGRIGTYYLKVYIQYGVLATTVAGLVIFQAFHCFRTMSYETFLAVHIILVVVFIVACFYHCYDIGYLEWIYVSWALWGGDRVQRVIRMCMFGFRKANIELIADDTFKVSVKHNKLFRPFPGAFAYIYFITPTMFWQSHPFTIIDEAINENETTVYIKAKAGITQRMKKYLSKMPGNKKTIRVSIEGPYGHRCPTDKYDTTLLWAGGNGIPGPYYHAIDLAKRGSAARQQIKLLWTFRNPETLYWFYDELKALAKTSVQTDIYITGQIPKIESSSDSDKEKKDTTSVEINGNSSDTDSSKPSSVLDVIDSLSGHINFHYGRPDLEQLIVENFTEETNPSVCVMTCGPNKMVDNVRGFTAKHLQSAKGRIDLFEELQVW